MEAGVGVRWIQVKESWQPPEAGRGSRFSPGASQRNTTLLTRGFPGDDTEFGHPVPSTVREYISFVLRHQACGNSLQESP